jgi:hypothetical protein
VPTDNLPRGGDARFVRRAVDATLREACWITYRRLMFVGCLLAVLSLFLAFNAVRFFTTQGVASAGGMPLAGDFLNFYAGAKAAASGQARLVYDHAWFLALQHGVVGPSRFLLGIYSYPPTALLLTLPLAPFSYLTALGLWMALGAGLCGAALQRLVGWRAAALALIGAPAAMLELFAGQTGYFTAALLGGGLTILERRPLAAGICFGCLAYKPQMALLLPFALVAGGSWRTLAAAAATLLVIVVVSVLLFGAETWAGFLGQMSVQSHLLESDIGFWRRMPTVFVAARQLSGSAAVADAVQLFSATAALAAIVVVWRLPRPTEVKAAMLVVATFLATPYAYDYEEVVLIFAAAWLGREGRRTGSFLPWERISVLALLVLPAATFVNWFSGVPLGPVVLWLVLLVLIRRAVASPGRPPSAFAT